MQAALRQRILENMGTAVVVLDAGFTVVALNPAAETLLETSARQSVGVPFARVARGDEFAELAGRALAGRIDVVDNGPGVRPDLAESVFYPMVSGRPGGSGLGLPIAQSLVSRHGGIIEYEREAGETAFSILLPITAPPG